MPALPAARRCEWKSAARRSVHLPPAARCRRLFPPIVRAGFQRARSLPWRRPRPCRPLSAKTTIRRTCRSACVPRREYRRPANDASETFESSRAGEDVGTGDQSNIDLISQLPIITLELDGFTPRAEYGPEFCFCPRGDTRTAETPPGVGNCRRLSRQLDSLSPASFSFF